MLIHTCEIPPDKKACTSCNSLLFLKDNFCGNCGSTQHLSADTSSIKRSLIYALGYYFAMLFLIFGLIRFYLDGNSFDALFYEDLMMIGITLLFGAFNFKNLIPVLIKPIKIKIALSVMVVMVGFAFLVHLFTTYTPVINEYSHNYYTDYVFSAFPLFFMILSIGVVPGLFEELAFRGFVYNNFKNVVSEKTTMWITTLLFAILHLSPISYLFIIPIGYFFAYLRMKHNHIWYGVIGHFTYNTTICLIDYYQFYN